MEKNFEQLQFPVGRFTLPAEVTPAEIKQAIVKIAIFPSRISEAIGQIKPDFFEATYRPDGWTVRQVVHHCADSHMNAFIRFKLALTEEAPVIKPYEQAKWAEQPDYLIGPEISLNILEGIHTRWVTLMESMREVDWEKTFIHPEYNRVQKLKQTVMLYAWHGEHHLGHVLNAKAFMGKGD